MFFFHVISCEAKSDGGEANLIEANLVLGVHEGRTVKNVEVNENV
jgi:hypothetical protein